MVTAHHHFFRARRFQEITILNTLASQAPQQKVLEKQAGFARQVILCTHLYAASLFVATN